MKTHHIVLGFLGAFSLVASMYFGGMGRMADQESFASARKKVVHTVPAVPVLIQGVAYPDPERTPGALNQSITQANISQNICNPKWSTKSIRPPVSYTTPLKVKQIGEYGYADTSTASYEEDHLISLELGGNPTDPKNLWPEPYATANPDGGAKRKDTVENFLHKQVCAGKITLQEAQREISTDWYSVLLNNHL